MWRPVDRRVRWRWWNRCSCFGGRDSDRTIAMRHLVYWSCVHNRECARTEPSTAPICEAERRCIPSRGCARTATKTRFTLCATSSMVLCCRRAARRRTGSHHKAYALTVRSAKECAGNRVAVLCSTDFPVRSSEVAVNKRCRSVLLAPAGVMRERCFAPD